MSDLVFAVDCPHCGGTNECLPGCTRDASEAEVKRRLDRRRPNTYILCLRDVADRDIAEIERKDVEYGGSWKKRGGVGAYMMAVRKIDRLEEQLKKVSYDIFAAIEGDRRSEGVLDDLRDLRRYLLLIEAEMVARGVVK